MGIVYYIHKTLELSPTFHQSSHVSCQDMSDVPIYRYVYGFEYHRIGKVLYGTSKKQVRRQREYRVPTWYLVENKEVPRLLAYLRYMPVYFIFLQVAKKHFQLALRSPNLLASLEACTLRHGTRHRRNCFELCFYYCQN